MRVTAINRGLAYLVPQLTVHRTHITWDVSCDVGDLHHPGPAIQQVIPRSEVHHLTLLGFAIDVVL
jgi:hypothetical protein